MDPKQLVLRRRDLPAGFSPAGARPVSNALARARTHRDYARLGRIKGYEAAYATASMRIESDASVYVSAAKAHGSFAGAARLAAGDRTMHALPLTVPLGDEAHLYTAVDVERGVRVHVCLVAWRSGPVILTLTAVGVPGTVDPAALVALAERQQARAGNLA